MAALPDTLEPGPEKPFLGIKRKKQPNQRKTDHSIRQRAFLKVVVRDSRNGSATLLELLAPHAFINTVS